ncbi:GMC family oxidoreductase [Phycicoccus sonneratiae]|uniref:GMC family oxidoreductase N-terminal domain-containing protein n=1 Tax=Phycicoccus sonneratiae TaxID=2807628 RepID=A0ABS2CJQ1_9MICO|nr:GMC family oxidoreductase N-terminal domain-containing protein [Phycicoccus sonneraticus]MBM6400020.1 GMC family oxidoreductase N-terminal domain-containing protein [Phycicoccus sonneraticus]
MGSTYDYVIVGAGSAGAVVAARLSEDPDVRVCLLEAGGTPPPTEMVPAAVASLQNDPSTDWMFDGDPGGVGRGIVGGRMMVPRGKMLGGSSGLNYMAYVRGHPGDFDAWAEGGAEGWSYAEVLPYFLKAEGFVDSPELHADPDSHGGDGPVGVAVRQPVLSSANQFVEAAAASGMKQGDYNGPARLDPDGVASLFQTTTKDGRRSSTYHAYLEPVMDRENLTVVTGALVERVLLERDGDAVRATGVAYRTEDGGSEEVHAGTEVVLSAGAIGSPHLLLLSGVGAREKLASVGVECVVDLPDVGRHLKDHLHTPLMFAADGIGETMTEVAMGLGPDALRAPAGPLPADPADDADLPEPLAAAKAEAERRIGEWFTTGRGIASSSLYDAVAFFSTGLGDTHTHDAQIGFLACGYTPGIWEAVFRLPPAAFFEDPESFLDPTRGQVVLLPNPVQPHSEGSVTLASADPAVPPRIMLNYFDDPHDVAVMLAVMRKALEFAAAWPGGGLGDPVIPPHLAGAHEHTAGDEPSDALLEDLARHYALTVYHETSTCRIGDVVDPRLRVRGIDGLRVADASVMPNVVSGNTNAAAIMIGEKAAEMVAADHGVRLHRMVG